MITSGSFACKFNKYLFNKNQGEMKNSILKSAWVLKLIPSVQNFTVFYTVGYFSILNIFICLYGNHKSSFKPLFDTLDI